MRQGDNQRPSNELPPSGDLRLTQVKLNQPKISIPLILLLLAVIGFSAMKIYECYPYDIWLEMKISDQLAERKKNKSIEPLDIEKLTGKKVSRLCVQTPYIWKEYFEQHYVGENVDHYFRNVDETLNVLWIFYTDSTVSQVRIRRWQDMLKANGSVLCSQQVSSLSFKRNHNSIEFLISEK